MTDYNYAAELFRCLDTSGSYCILGQTRENMCISSETVSARPEVCILSCVL